MLSELRIVDLGVIGEADIAPSPGFTVVTGETGAGKTMIVSGLSLLSGAKADPKLIRSGAARALVEGRWVLDPAQAGAVEELGGELELGGEVLVSRQLAANRSRMSVGGAQVPINQGSGLVGEWVTIHGQSEQLRLGTPERQREVLDAWAWPKLAEVLGQYRQDYAERRQALAQLRELTEHAQARARELDMLRFGLEEIAKADPQAGEDAALAEEAKRLQAVDELRMAAHGALEALAGSEDSFDSADAVGLLGQARKSLLNAQDADPKLGGFSDQVADALAAANDAAAGLASYLDSLEADPLRLEWIAGRRAELQSLTRKYGNTIDEVLAWAGQSAQRVLELDGGQDRVEALQAKVAELDAALQDRAEQISAIRRQAGEQLVKLATAELAALAMPHASLEFELTRLDEPGPHGRDQVQLLFSANPGSVPGPLGKIASGGELSRVRLALEVVLAQSGTYVFDEVDAGVGGAVALEIGRRLKRLAASAQVIVVTHLAQVAAFADRHFVVSKADDGQVTVSGVREVVGADRLDVLAKMMGGVDSGSARAHAEDLLKEART